MKTVNNNYTSVEQSKKLIELGLDPESADMCYHFPDIQEHNYALCLPWEKVHLTEKENSLPCWSVGALFDLFPIFTEPTAFSCKVSVPTIHHLSNEYEIIYEGDYEFPMIISDNIASVVSFKRGNLIDACYEMVVWLLENGYIKKGG